MEKHYRDYFKQNLSGFYVSTPGGKLLDCNSAFVKLMGYGSKEEILKINVRKFYPIAKLRTDFIKTLIQKKSLVNYEVKLKKKDEQTIHCLLNAVGQFNNKKELEKIQGFIIDITPYKKVEEALRNSQTQLQNIFTVAPIGIGVVINRIIQNINNRFCKITGYTRKELIGSNSRIVYATEEDYEYVGREKYRLIKKFGTGSVETRFKRKDGKIIDVLLNSTPINPAKLSEGITFTALDITERMEMRKALEENEEKYRTMFEGSLEGITLFNHEGEILEVNNAYCDMIGYSRGELLNMAWKDINAVEKPADSRRHLRKIIETGSERFETKHRRKDGQIIDVEISVRLHDKERNIMASFLRDITRQKNAEKALKESKQLLDQVGDIAGIGGWELNLQEGKQETTWTKAIYDIFELELDSVLPGLHQQKDWYIPEHQNMVKSKIQELIDTRKPIQFEAILKTSRGKLKWCLVKGEAVEQNGKLVKLRGTYQDISERKAVEKALIDSEERFRSIYENSNVGIYRTTPEGQILMANPALLKLLGFKDLHELSNRNLNQNGFDPIYPRTRFLKLFEKDDKIKGFEATWIRADGKQLHLRENATAFRDTRGKIKYFDGFVEDISDQKMIEKNLIESEQLMKEIAANYPNSYISIIEKDLTIGFSSGQEFYKQNLDPNQFVGKTLDQVFGDHSDVIHKHYRQSFMGKEQNFELYFDNQHQHYRTVPLYADDGSIPRILAVAENITERKLAEKKLIDSETRYRRLFESAQDAIIIIDASSGIIIDANPFVENLLEYPVDGLLGKELWQISPLKHLGDNKKKFLELQKKKHIRYENLTLQSKSGKAIQVEFVSNVYLVEGFKVIQCNIRDLTERRKLETLLFEEKRKLDTLIDNVPGIVYRCHTNRSRTMEFVSKGWRILTGYSQMDLTGDKTISYADIIHPDDRQYVWSTVQKAINRNQPFRLEYRIIDAKQREKWVFERGKPIYSGNMTDIKLEGLLTDITERKSMVQKLAESEQKFRSLFESSNDAFAYLDLSGKILDTNKAGLKIFGSTRKELIGKYFNELDIFSTVEKSIVSDQFRQMLRDEGKALSLALTNRKGKKIMLDSSSTIITKNNKPIGVLVMSRDITDRVKIEAELHKESQRAQKYLDIVRVMIVALNRKAEINLVNRTTCDLLGYKENNLIGKKWVSNFVPIQEQKKVKNVLQKLIAGDLGSFKYIESSILTKKGQQRTIAWTNTVVRDENGRITGTLSSGSDITEQKKMLDQLRSSEERLKILFEFAPDGYYLNDLKGTFIDGNLQAEKLIGVKREEMIGKNMLKTIKFSPRDKLKAAKSLARNALGQSTEREEFSLIRPDGNKIVLEVSTHPIVIGSKSLVLGIARNVTESKKMQAELEKYRQYLEKLVRDRTERLNLALIESESNRDRIDTILKSVSEGLIVSDINHSVILMNSLAEDWLGISFSEAFQKKTDQVFQQKKIVRLIDRELLDVKGNRRFDIKMQDISTGKNRILEVTAKTILDRKSQKMGVLTTLRDVSHDREMNRIKTEFLSTAAHELRTPLTTVRGFSEVLLNRKDLTEDEKQKFLKYINQQAVNLGNIISDLLDISRIESGVGFKLKRKECSINGVVLKLIENYRISHSSHTFVSKLEETDTTVLADCEKIEQVLQNLLSNAINYSSGKGEIRISTKLAGDDYRVEVHDQGKGMTLEQVTNIFEKFYQVDSSDTAPMGTGLGMSIVKLIIDAHRGKIWVKSQPKKGTWVVFTIPIGPEARDRAKEEDSGEINIKG